MNQNNKIRWNRCFIILFVWVGCVTLSNVHAKEIDPSLRKFLSPNVRHAIGIAQLPADLQQLWIKRFGREPRFIQSFGIKTSWPNFCAAIPHTLTDHWPKEDRTYVYSLQMLRKAPRPENEIPESLRQKYPTDPASMEAGVDGMYDDQWKWFGQLLNQYTQEDLDKLIIRLGHEFNGYWYEYSTKPKNATPEITAKRSEWFKLYWRRIHQIVMKELNGKRVRWDFCPSGGMIHTTETLPEIGDAYPGDEYVDIIGMDCYAYANTADKGEEGRGGWEYCKSHSFTWLSRFAEEHGKMTAIDETNITYKIKDGKQQGSDDSPEWFEGLQQWAQQEVDAHRLSHITLFETEYMYEHMWHACVIRRVPIPGREKQELNFPKSAAKIIELWGGKE